MSDGLHSGTSAVEPTGEFTSFDSRRHEERGLDFDALTEWLPRLGTVLWLHRPRRDNPFPRARFTGRGVLLLEDADIGAFVDATAIRVRSAVTPYGPREWLDIDAGANTVARLYLLPDTDYLAWDAMTEALGSEPASAEPFRRWHAHRNFMKCAFSRARRTWHARAVRFALLRLPCLQVLGARDAELSTLGNQLAAAIVTDEHAHSAIA